MRWMECYLPWTLVMDELSCYLPSWSVFLASCLICNLGCHWKAFPICCGRIKWKRDPTANINGKHWSHHSCPLQSLQYLSKHFISTGKPLPLLRVSSSCLEYFLISHSFALAWLILQSLHQLAHGGLTVFPNQDHGGTELESWKDFSEFLVQLFQTT